jgi:hypothetical protein
MQRNQGTARWLVLFLKAGGLTSLFLLPFSLAANPPSVQSVAMFSPDPNTYDPEVKQLLDTTYLGYGNSLPDPGEPAEVLEKYLNRTTLDGKC